MTLADAPTGAAISEPADEAGPTAQPAPSEASASSALETPEVSEVSEVSAVDEDGAEDGYAEYDDAYEDEYFDEDEDDDPALSSVYRPRRAERGSLLATADRYSVVLRFARLAAVFAVLAGIALTIHLIQTLQADPVHEGGWSGAPVLTGPTLHIR